MPNPEAQEALLRGAYDIAGKDPKSDIAYVEMHGTGTPLGDPIEAKALGSILSPSERFIPIGSVKSNIGHCEAAAGIMGLI